MPVGHNTSELIMLSFMLPFICLFTKLFSKIKKTLLFFFSYDSLHFDFLLFIFLWLVTRLFSAFYFPVTYYILIFCFFFPVTYTKQYRKLSASLRRLFGFFFIFVFFANNSKKIFQRILKFWIIGNLWFLTTSVVSSNFHHKLRLLKR